MMIMMVIKISKICISSKFFLSPKRLTKAMITLLDSEKV